MLVMSSKLNRNAQTAFNNSSNLLKLNLRARNIQTSNLNKRRFFSETNVVADIIAHVLILCLKIYSAPYKFVFEIFECVLTIYVRIHILFYRIQKL